MFEMIGLLIATGLFFGLALIVGLILAFVVWLLVRKKPLPRKSLISAAVLLPIFSAAYLWLCAALLPGQTLFGDISQPLPNGYLLEALGKMPDFANISKPGAYGNNGFTQNVGLLAVDGPLVVGRYSHPFSQFTPDPSEPYFIFDTRTDRNREVPTYDALQQSVGHPVHLVKVELFHSQEPSYLWHQKLEHTIMFAPPILGITIFFLIVLAWSRSVPAISPTIYT